MVTHPISVPRHRYQGGDSRKARKAQRYNEIAVLCENYLNKKIQDNPDEIQQYLYGYIAIDLNLTTDEVREVLYGVDGGHNGLTVKKNPTQYGDVSNF